MSDDLHNDNANRGDLNGDDMHNDDLHFSDEELDAALAGFEKEFASDADAAADAASDTSDAADSAASVDDAAAADVPDDASSLEPDLETGFESELDGLLGNKAKAAIIITRLSSARLLAAFCELSDIAASCIGSPQGAVAVLHNLDGDGPENAAKDLTTVVAGMSVVLAVNRADKLEATLYFRGNPGRQFPPPILFSSTPSFVEDLMLGIDTLDALRQHMPVEETADMTHDEAMKVLDEHMRFGRGGSAQSRR